MMKKIFLIMSFILLSNNSYSNECSQGEIGSYWNNTNGSGWFWYQKECIKEESNSENNIEKKEEFKTLPKKAKIPWDILDNLDPDEIAQKIEPEARKVSIMYPTEENITAYRQLVNWIANKAIVYTNKDEQIRTTNPTLMPDLEYFRESPYKEKFVIAKINEISKNTLLKYKNNAGLVIYVSQSCSFCEQQKPIINWFQEKYGWNILYKEISHSPSDILRFNINITPDIFIVLKNKNGEVKYQRIATGLTVLSDLEKFALKGLSYLGEDINEELISY